MDDISGWVTLLSITGGNHASSQLQRVKASLSALSLAMIALSMSSLPPNPSTIHQEKTQDDVKHLQTGQHLGDEADQYTDSLLSHFKSGGTCNTHSHMIRHFANTRSPVNIHITKTPKIMAKAHNYNCVRY